MAAFNPHDQYAFIAGGSRGLGKCLAIELAKRGAHIVLLARGRESLEKAKGEVLLVCKAATQTVDIIVVDLRDPPSMRAAVAEHGAVPDIFICCAGGTPPNTLGFLADLDAEQLKLCFESNYYTALFMAQRCLQLWIANPKPDSTRHIVLIASAAAFVAIPGYAAYTPSKTALRALADTLRVELLLYGDENMYRVHCAFPGTFLTEAFMAQEEAKPNLTKKMEGSDYPTEDLVKQTQPVEAIANKILRGLDNGRFFITTDMKTDLILNNMRGPSPRDRSIYEVVMGFVAMLAWPVVRRMWDAMVTNYRHANTSQKNGRCLDVGGERLPDAMGKHA